MFEMNRMTDRSRRVMQLAEQQARHLASKTVDPEHVLFGLALEGAGVGAAVLRILGVGPQQIAELLPVPDPHLRPGDFAHPSIAIASETQRVITRSVAEATLLGHHYIGTEHLLLGVALAGEGVVREILNTLGLSPVTVRSEVYSLLGHRE